MPGARIAGAAERATKRGARQCPRYRRRVNSDTNGDDKRRGCWKGISETLLATEGRNLSAAPKMRTTYTVLSEVRQVHLNYSALTSSFRRSSQCNTRIRSMTSKSKMSAKNERVSIVLPASVTVIPPVLRDEDKGAAAVSAGIRYTGHRGYFWAFENGRCRGLLFFLHLLFLCLHRGVTGTPTLPPSFSFFPFSFCSWPLLPRRAPDSSPCEPSLPPPSPPL